EAIVAEELGTGYVHRFDLVDLTLSGGMSSTPTAKVVVANGDGKIDAEGSGNGMIDAAIAAIAAATGVEVRLTDFQVHAVTGGAAPCARPRDGRRLHARLGAQRAPGSRGCRRRLLGRDARPRTGAVRRRRRRGGRRARPRPSAAAAGSLRPRRVQLRDPSLRR